MTKIFLIFLSSLMLILLSSYSQDLVNTMDQNGKSKMKSAILLVAFGTSYEESAKVYENINVQTKQKFSEFEIRWAYTSKKIREKLSKKGIKLDSVQQALEKLKQENFNNVYIQSLHIIPGREYDELSEVYLHFKPLFNTLKISPPLLNSLNDIKSTLQIMLSKVPPERSSSDAIVFMGHGSPQHHADLIYAATFHILQKYDSHAFIACVEGNPKFEEILSEVETRQFKRVFLIPFMSVAGDHAINDMAGDDDESWKSLLNKKGIEAIPILKGMAEHSEIINIWLQHLENTIKNSSE